MMVLMLCAMPNPEDFPTVTHIYNGYITFERKVVWKEMIASNNPMCISN